MKLELKKRPPAERDLKKKSIIDRRLQSLSMRIRRKQIKALRNKPLKRGSDPSDPTQSPPDNKSLIKVNVSGNLRGMHNYHNPPDSEKMRKIRAMRRFYNKQMPVLQCSGCAYANVCPQFKAGYECAFLPFLNAHKVESEKDLVEYMKELLGAQMRRTHQALLMETLAGGAPSLETSEALNLAFMQLNTLHTKMADADKANISIETNDSSIISKIFGDLTSLKNQTKAAQAKPIEVSPVIQSISNSVDSPLLLEDRKADVNDALILEHTKEELEHAAEGVRKARKRSSGEQREVIVSVLEK